MTPKEKQDIQEALGGLYTGIRTHTFSHRLDRLPTRMALGLAAVCEAVRLLSEHIGGSSAHSIHHLASIMSDRADGLSKELSETTIPDNEFIAYMRNQYGAIGIIANGLKTLTPDYTEAGDVPITILVEQAEELAYELSNIFERIAG